MAVIHERCFEIRHYECDLFGFLHKAVLFRYMQETAYEAAESVGYGMVYHNQTSKAWFVRCSELEILKQLRYGDTVKVRTWVADFKRVRSIRMYEITKVNEDRVAAKGWTDWVYLNRETGKPETIPEDMIQAFSPGWDEKHFISRKKTTKPPLPGSGYYKFPRIVQYSDLDPAQHVNNAVYISFLDDCIINSLADLGWSQARIIANGWIIRDLYVQIEYFHQLNIHDEIYIQTWISEYSESRWNRLFLIKKLSDDQITALANIKQELTLGELGKPINFPNGFLG